MKKILLLFCLSLLSLSTLHAEITWSLSDDGTLTISGTNMPDYNESGGPWYFQKGKIKKVEIKDGVKNIGKNAFRGSSLTSIQITNSVTSIGDAAFYECSSLTSIQIPNSVTSIGDAAFNRCSSLASIQIPNSVTSIGDAAFYECSSLTSIQIPNSVTSIGYAVFASCFKLTSVTIPNSVTSIGDAAFGSCSSLASIQIPNSVISIGDYAFAGCSQLTSVTIPNSVTSIGDAAFFICNSLTSIQIPNSVVSIGDNAFRLCKSLVYIKVDAGNTYYDSRDNCNAIIETSTNTLLWGCKSTVIPNSVTSIGQSAFLECSGLTSVTIPNSVTSIGEEAFWSCIGLTSITIPNSVTSIGSHAFVYCRDLTSITNLSTIPQIISYGTFSEYGTLHVLPGCKEVYQKADYWNNFTIVEDAVDPFATIELADGKTYNNETTQDNKEISYTRTFGNTSWQSLYIPFSMTFDDWKDDFEVAYINGIRQMDTDDDGAIDETIMDVVKIKSGSLIPNTPYLIRAKSTGNKTITVNDATLYKSESNSVDCSTTIAKYTFTGTYSAIPAATLLANNYYAMGGGSLIMTDGTSDLKPYRWYLNVESRSPMYNVSNGAKAITINVVGEEEATGISQMSSDREHSSTIYDLNGRRMSQKTLKSGLYIKNGKKIIIK